MVRAGWIVRQHRTVCIDKGLQACQIRRAILLVVDLDPDAQRLRHLGSIEAELRGV
jgi:hypothetical protein